MTNRTDQLITKLRSQPLSKETELNSARDLLDSWAGRHVHANRRRAAARITESLAHPKPFGIVDGAKDVSPISGLEALYSNQPVVTLESCSESNHRGYYVAAGFPAHTVIDLDHQTDAYIISGDPSLEVVW